MKLLSSKEAAAYLGVPRGQIRNWTAKGVLEINSLEKTWRKQPTYYFTIQELDSFKDSNAFMNYHPRPNRRKDVKKKDVTEPKATASAILTNDELIVLREMLDWYRTVHYKPTTTGITPPKKEYSFINQDKMPPAKAFDGFQEARDILLSYSERTGNDALQIAAFISVHREWTYGNIASNTIQQIMNGKFTWNKAQNKWYAPMSTGKMRRMAFLLKPFLPKSRR